MKKYIVLVSMLVCFRINSNAQGYLDILNNAKPTDNFISVAKKVNDFFEPLEKLQKRNEGYNLWKRWEYYAMSHLDSTGNVGNKAKYNFAALTQEKESATLRNNNRQTENFLNGQWSPLGPNGLSAPSPNYLGRVNCVAFDPITANTIYVGTPNGGVWKSYSGGSFWFPISDDLPSLCISSIAIHPTNPNIIYVLTGDGDASVSANYFQTGGAGVFKSTDGGTTWRITGLSFIASNDVSGYEMVMCPTNANVLIAATSNGIYRTTNAGNTWVRETTNSTTSIHFKPNDPTKVIAIEKFANRLIRSSDTGNVWIQCPSFTIPTTGSLFRCEIAVTPANPDVVYVNTYKSLNNYQGLHTYNWATNTVAVLSTTPDITGPFGWYCQGLWVSPIDANLICAAGTQLFRSTDGGVTFFLDQDIVHADVHGYYYNNLNGKLYVACDGGILVSTNNGDTWTNLTNNLQITEYYRISGLKTNVDYLLGGTQDNGHHLRKTNTAVFDWRITCCDGMDNAIEQTNPNIMYGFTQEGQLNKSVDGGATFAWLPPTISGPGREPWVTDFLIHPTTPATVFYGSLNGVLRHTARAEPTNAWQNIGGATRAVDMAISASNPNRLYAVSKDTFFRTDNVNVAVPTWVKYRPIYPIQNITSMDVNPDNDQEVWITVSGYASGVKVYRSLNAGASWTNESDNLPNISVHVIKFEDTNGFPAGAVYIGTDIGVYYRNDFIGQWVFFSNGLPATMVMDIELNELNNTITAATYGRGIWRSDSYLAACSPTINFTQGLHGVEYHQASSTITLSNDVYGGVGTKVILKAGNSVTFTPGVDVKAGNELKAFIGPCANDNPIFRQAAQQKDSIKTSKNKE